MTVFHRTAFFAVALAISGIALAAGPTPTPTPTPPTSTPTVPTMPTTPATPTTVKPMEELSDAQIASLVMAIDQSEIDTAKYMVGKATDPNVKTFAQHMADEHGTMMASVKAWQSKTGAQNGSSKSQSDIATGAKTAMTDLGRLTGRALDTKYIDAEVVGHQKVLDLLDRGLIDQADDAELKTALGAARAKVAAHLDTAKRLQSSLGASTAPTGGSIPPSADGQ